MSKIKRISQISVIKSFIQRLNHCWLKRQFEEMEPLFHKNAVLVHPGDGEHVVGSQQIIETYWEFMDTAVVSDFKVVDESIHVIEETAVAYYTYRIQYTVETTHYDEKVAEILVFREEEGKWKIVWRTQMPGL